MSKNLTLNRNRLLKFFKLCPLKKPIVHSLNFIHGRRLLRLQTPENIIFFVTSRCNARCRHCFYWQSVNREQRELNLDQIGKIASSLRNRLDTLLITGGEPFLRNDLYEIISLFYKLNHTRKFHITSNGSMPERITELCRKILAEMNVELSLQLSLDGNKQFHDQFRGAPIFQKVIESLLLLKPLENQYRNFILSAATTLTQNNLVYLEYLHSLMGKMKVRWGFNLLRDVKYGIMNLDPDFIADYNVKDAQVKLPPINLLETLLDKYYPRDVNLSAILTRTIMRYSIMILQNKKPPLKCMSGIVDGVLYANGDVALCEMTNPIGNLERYNYDFHALWQSEEARRLRNKISSCSCIHPCHMINSMKYNYSFLLENC